MMKHVILCLGLLLLSRAAYPVEFYISPSGDDNNPGSLELPFASLVAARDAIRVLPAADRQEDILVYLRSGSYFLKETLVFGIEDGAADGFSITYLAYGDEIPILSSALHVTDWQRLKKSPKSLPKPARGNVWVAPVPPGVDEFYSLYDGEDRLARARSKGFRPLPQDGIKEEDMLSKLSFPEGAIKDWPDLADAELLVIPEPWTMNILPVASVDEKNHIATTSIAGSYPLTPTRNWEESAWIENVIDFLDEPGEWVVNRLEGRIYYWPESGDPGNNILIPTLKELIRVEGKTDYEGPEDIPVKNLEFRGITFMHGKRDLWDADHAGWGVQHDWEFFDRPTALLRFRGAEKCTVDACRFTASGGTAIRGDLHCQQIKISNNLIEHMGNFGILFCGYGPGTKDVNKKNLILNNHIRQIGELYWHGHGIMLWQSGNNLVSHNLIHHGPRNGISISGVRYSAFNPKNPGKSECSGTVRWKEINPVEYNETHHMLQKLGDCAAINVSGAGEGNIIRRNYIHHISNREANASLRTDGWQKGTYFVENVLYKTGGITRKSFNHVEHNLMIDLDSERYILFVGFPHEDDIDAPEEGSRVIGNVMYAISEEDVSFFLVPERHFRHSSQVKHCLSDYNIFYHADYPLRSRNELMRWQGGGTDQHSLSADPLIMDIDKEDFRFKPGSPALKMGIPQLDVREMGLLDAFPLKYR